MQEFTVGIYAVLEEKYNSKTMRYEEHLAYKCKDWCDQHATDFYRRDQGMVLVCLKEVTLFDSEHVTREEVVTGMVAGLREKQTELRAEAQASCNLIEEKINKLLCITDQRSEENLAPTDSVFAPYPRKPATDATDTEFDDIPF
jgi:hypothetical protein